MKLSQERMPTDTEEAGVFEQPIDAESVKGNDFFDDKIAEAFNSQKLEEGDMTTELNTALEQVDALDDNATEKTAENNGMIQELAKKLRESDVAKVLVFAGSLALAGPSIASAAELGKDDMLRQSLSTQQNVSPNLGRIKMTPNINLERGPRSLLRMPTNKEPGPNLNLEVTPQHESGEIRLNRELYLHDSQMNLLNNPQIRDKFKNPYNQPHQEGPGTFINRDNSSVGSVSNDGGEINIGTTSIDGRIME